MRYLFCSLSNYGFLFSSLGIAEVLKQRGHEVAFAADPSMAGVIERAGFRRISRGEKDGPSFVVERAGHPVDTLRQVRHLERALESFGADVLVGQQLTLGAHVVATRTGVRLATVGMGSFLWPTAVPPAEPRLRAFVIQRFRGFYLAYQTVLEMLGEKPPAFRVEDNPLLGDLFLLRSVPELEGDTSVLPRNVHCVGDCLWEAPVPPQPELERWLAEARASGAPVIYSQPGRSFEKRSFWQDVVEAFGGQPVRVATSVGRMDGERGAVPENFFVRDHVPQTQVLEQARVVICSATTTSVLGAITRGLPLLLVPGGGGAEQVDLSQRCVDAGVAIRLPAAEVTVERLRASVDALLGEGSYRSKATALREAFLRAGGRERAADLLEELGRTAPGRA
jgi:UDP:flavonoid glycosyltransferase YjiC (YdhE family)